MAITRVDDIGIVFDLVDVVLDFDLVDVALDVDVVDVGLGVDLADVDLVDVGFDVDLARDRIKRQELFKFLILKNASKLVNMSTGLLELKF